MSPDARLIAAAILTASPIGKDSPRVLGELEARLAAQFPDHDRGIRGMVPVAYMKDVLQGVIARIEAGDEQTIHQFAAEALAYAKRTLAQVEAL